ncbi:uncharacterized protein [Amphiura filiformis]|uniref:uncharacterized protein n=1 Tax=Amphiura filiformis TaxID=82378 RepID=UPI003B22202E
MNSAERVPPDELKKESILNRVVPIKPVNLSDFTDSSGKVDYDGMAERARRSSRKRKAVTQVDRPQPYPSPSLPSNPGTSSISVPSLPEEVVGKDSIPDDTAQHNPEELMINKTDHAFLAYLQKVIDSNEVHVIYGTKPLVVAVQDISADMARFINRYQVVERRALQFLMGKVKWVYMCSCDMKKADRVKHLSKTLQTTYDGYIDEHHSRCYHMQIAEHAYYQIDADLDISVEDVFNQDIHDEHQYAMSTIEDCVFPMALPRHVCHFDRGQQRYGVVTIEDGKFICLTCCKPSCCHTAYFNTLRRSKCELPEFLQPMVHPEVDPTEPGKPKAGCKTPKAISCKKNPIWEVCCIGFSVRYGYF